MEGQEFTLAVFFFLLKSLFKKKSLLNSFKVINVWKKTHLILFSFSLTFQFWKRFKNTAIERIVILEKRPETHAWSSKDTQYSFHKHTEITFGYQFI